MVSGVNLICTVQPAGWAEIPCATDNLLPVRVKAAASIPLLSGQFLLCGRCSLAVALLCTLKDPGPSRDAAFKRACGCSRRFTTSSFSCLRRKLLRKVERHSVPPLWRWSWSATQAAPALCRPCRRQFAVRVCPAGPSAFETRQGSWRNTGLTCSACMRTQG